LVGHSLPSDVRNGIFDEMNAFNCLVILGPTASGKTKMAARLASEIPAEIISADSRQVYRYLTIGTGKDLSEYVVDGKQIPYHLIDIVNAEEQFFLHDFIAALEKAFLAVQSVKKIPIICGGTGLYLDVLQKTFELTQIPENDALRESLALKTVQELQKLIANYPSVLTAQVDLHSHKRLIRGIEIAEYSLTTGTRPELRPSRYQPFYIGIQTDTESRREKIKIRLQQRLKEGLIEEVEALLHKGFRHERLQRLGLEYKFISLYLQGELTRSDFETRLTTAIQQFAKRQMTWFRKMEKEGCHIHWMPADTDTSALIQLIQKETNLITPTD